MRLRGRQAGFALIVVLWSLALLTAIGVQLAGTGRQEAQLARNLVDSAVLEAAADGAVQQAIFRLLDTSPQRRWYPDGGIRIVPFGRNFVRVRIEDETGKVNPNIAPAELLQALLLESGAAPRTAAEVAAGIAAWRSAAISAAARLARAAPYAAAGRDYAPPGAPFESVEEVGAVLGMTPALMARLRPHLTVFTEDDPDAATPDLVVAAALADVARGAPAALTQAGGRSVVEIARITAIAEGSRGLSFGERFIVRTNARTGPRRYEILSREMGVSGF
jgi:general secretion pathway protein K